MLSARNMTVQQEEGFYQATVVGWDGSIVGEYDSKLYDEVIGFLAKLPAMILKVVRKVQVRDSHVTLYTVDPIYFSTETQLPEFIVDVVFVPPTEHVWTTIRFGKYRGKSTWEVFKTDPEYIGWLKDKVTSRKAPRLYQDLRILEFYSQV